jgi:FtsP/CotA-like multicopper oxidase with cupredoxin domain
MIHTRTRLLFTSLAVAIALSGSLPTVAQVDDAVQPEQACADPTESTALFAERIGKNKIGYGRTPTSATIPGPTLVMTEGQCLAVTLTNDTNKRLSMHAHGVDYTVASDGTPLNNSCVAPGRSRTYVFEAHAPITRTDGTVDPGSAGYWHYHDHCMQGDHGTAGIAAGLFGAFVVRRVGDPEPDRPPFVVVMSKRTINLKKAPKTPTFTANLGERVEFVVIGHGELFHTFHLHGHRWVDNRTGVPSGATDPARIIDNRTIGPADSFGFQVIAGEGVGPGAWMYHCHVQGHSDAGMTGIFMVKTATGQATQASWEALRRWRRSSMNHHEHHGS